MELTPPVSTTAPTMLPAREIVQVVDENGRFRENLATTLQEWGFDVMGFEYFVVAVLGVQSSGKSTLLNMLFGTRFDVMDAQRGRSQTTLGVWLGHTGTTQRHMLVFDVEGTDSKERGEEHGAFERKTSLLSLALSEVLLINMWTNDVGRFEGANYSLLKIVFEMNLRLFQGGGASKTLLLFVFRDHVPEQTSVEKLAATIRGDMVQIWEGMVKPDKFAHSRIDDFFDFRFVGLPHKVYQAALFADAVQDLQRQFLDDTHAQYVLEQRYKTDVPADGFARYAEKIWETIQEEKDLNLPTQKQMLALYRCEEIAKGVFDTFQSTCEAAWGARIEAGESVRHFGKQATEAIQSALAEYDHEARRYDVDVQASKRADLLSRMDAHLRPTFHSLLKALASISRERFVKLVRTDLPDGALVRDFVHVAAEIETTTLAHFDELAVEATVSLFPSWSSKAERDELLQYIKGKLEAEREQQLRRFADHVQKALSHTLRTRLAKAFDRSAENLWTVVASEYKNAREVASRDYEAVLGEFACAPDEVEERLSALATGTYMTLRSVVEDRVKNLDLLMAKRFKDAFELTAGGIPRQWSPKDDVAALWVDAKLHAEALVDLYSDNEDTHVFMLPEGATEYVSRDDTSDVSAEALVITPSEGERLLEKFRDYAIPPYHAACKEQERAAAQRTVPTYFLILLFVLGFNELVWVLSAIIWNPFLLLFVLLLTGGAFVVWKLNLSPLLVAGLVSLLRHMDATVQEKFVELIHGPLSAVSPAADASLRRHMTSAASRTAPLPVGRDATDSSTEDEDPVASSPVEARKAKAD